MIKLIAAAITVLAWLPMLGLVAALAVADAQGCALDEGSAHPCLVLGTDIGELLYSLVVLGWLAVVTLPVAILMTLAWLGWGLYALLRKRPA